MQPDRARPAEIEPWTNRVFIHRFSVALLPVATRTGLSPNAISVAGLLCGLGAAFAYVHWRDPLMATFGLVLMIAWHICDGLDGKLARATGKSSDFGRLLDGVCDYATFVVVYLALALTSDIPAATVPLALLAGAAHALTSLHYEAERSLFIARANSGGTEIHPAASIERGYIDLQERATRGSATFDTTATASARQQYVREAAPMLKLLSFESANTRTILIWLTALAGAPWLFWVIELTVLPLLSVLVARRLRALEKRLITAA